MDRIKTINKRILKTCLWMRVVSDSVRERRLECERVSQVDTCTRPHHHPHPHTWDQQPFTLRSSFAYGRRGRLREGLKGGTNQFISMESWNELLLQKTILLTIPSRKPWVAWNISNLKQIVAHFICNKKKIRLRKCYHHLQNIKHYQWKQWRK